MKETGSFSKKTVFISGAAGGVGTSVTKKMAEIGFRVIAVDINQSVTTCFKDVTNVISKTCDVSDIGQVRSLSEELGLEQEGLDCLISLAGIYGTYPVTEADPSLLKQITDVNFLGTAILINAFIKPLIKKRGRVIVMSSESHKIQTMFQPYMISKAALEAYCKVARQELALKDVFLTIIRPGAIRTPLLDWMSDPVKPGKYEIYDVEFMSSWKKSLRMVGRITSPEKVAERIRRAATVSSPTRIIRINNNPALTLVSMLPVRITEWLIIRMFKRKTN